MYDMNNTSPQNIRSKSFERLLEFRLACFVDTITKSTPSTKQQFSFLLFHYKLKGVNCVCLR